MRHRIIIAFALLFVLLNTEVKSHTWAVSKDTLQQTTGDTAIWVSKQMKRAKKMVQEINAIDTNYIEPQRYNFAVMLQNTNNYEVYRLNGRSGRSIVFAPEPTIKVGPYFGWRWVFLGYTFDIKHLGKSHQGNNKQEYDLSVYSSKIGVDLYYRKTGAGYKIRSIDLGYNIDTKPLEGTEFGGVTSSVRGLNVYYIFNHRRFSYPAAFSQSTVQRRSAGSPLIGIGYTRHTLDVNWGALSSLIEEKLSTQKEKLEIDSTLANSTIKYTDYAVSGGYAYNWVFAHNWLLAGSLSLGLAYKKAAGDIVEEHNILKRFSLKNMNLDATARFGIVWNNTKWYAGLSAIMHTYNYHKGALSTNNAFGNVNIYAGLNFGRKKK